MRVTASTTDYQFIVDFDIYPVHIHWSTIISDIADAGVIPYHQAQSINVSWSTFQRWKNGSTPAFDTGHALLILHSKTCGIELTQKRLEEFASTNIL